MRINSAAEIQKIPFLMDGKSSYGSWLVFPREELEGDASSEILVAKAGQEEPRAPLGFSSRRDTEGLEHGQEWEWSWEVMLDYELICQLCCSMRRKMIL